MRLDTCIREKILGNMTAILENGERLAILCAKFGAFSKKLTICQKICDNLLDCIVVGALYLTHVRIWQ